MAWLAPEMTGLTTGRGVRPEDIWHNQVTTIRKARVLTWATMAGGHGSQQLERCCPVTRIATIQ
jgi:hypothetical protein